MKWLKVKKSKYDKINNINSDKETYLLLLSPKPYTPTEKDKDVDCQVLSVKIKEAPTTMKVKQSLQNIQKEYDKSDEVNCFLLNEKKCWLDKDTRVGLINSINIQKDSGLITTDLWLNNKSYKVSIDYALTFLRALELYAVSCYNVTQLHHSEIEKIIDRDVLFEYDISTGYPTPIEFDNNEIIRD